MLRVLKKAMCWQFGLRSRVAEKSHAFSKAVPERFERDMGYNEKEFFRILPAAIGKYQYIKNDTLVEISLPNHAQQLQLVVSPLPDRKLGAFRIERIDVQFSFSNMSADERLQFMHRFDRRFQRGGG